MEFSREHILDFLEIYGKEVPSDSPNWLVELIMDDHICIKYDSVEYYIYKHSSFDDIDEIIYEYLNEWHHV